VHKDLSRAVNIQDAVIHEEQQFNHLWPDWQQWWQL